MKNGEVRSLTDLAWTSADAQWDSTAVRKDQMGKAEGISAQARVVIQYTLPAGSVRFKATGMVEKNGEGTGDGKVRFLTVVATRENEDLRPGLPVGVKLSELGVKGPVRIRNLWTHLEEGTASEQFAPVIPFHGAMLYRLTPGLDVP
jgi:hypothetical protein